jgi:serine/threonine protein kinase
LPRVGTWFLGFRLIALLGKGASGQVYLAEQGDLAGRYVALKVAPDMFDESQTLAQLQHTNIMPIYSVHCTGPLQAVCMPYFGATTLADVREQLHRHLIRPPAEKVRDDRGRERGRTTVPLLLSHTDTVPDPRSPGTAAAADVEPLRQRSYVEAVLWIGERIADGLAHAHDRGIVHHDLKPANILLTDDGQPMLLDFHIAADTKRPYVAAKAAGTLPYMSPEHLELARDPHRPLDARSDLFSVGVILYELLAGRRPFPEHAPFSRDALAEMIADRSRPVPSLCRVNPAVSPAVASIVAHCLEPNPTRRYQNAHQLHEDLRRQRHDLPLRYAPNRSIRERARKWACRHPRIASMSNLTVLLTVVLAVLTSALTLRGTLLARAEAEETLQQFRADARSARFVMLNRRADRDQLEDGMLRCRIALQRFAVLDNRHWLELPVVRCLPDVEQARLREDVGETLFVLAQATALHAQGVSNPVDRARELREARHLVGLAGASFGMDRVPVAVRQQGANLDEMLGDSEHRAQ